MKPMKPTFTVDMSKFRKDLQKLAGAARGVALTDAAEAGGRVIEAYAKINIESTFSAQSTGAMAGSIVVETSGSETKAEARIGPTVIYGRIHELGGIIKPVHAKLLHWIDELGHDVFARVVRIEARPYLRPAVDEHMDEITDAIGAAIKMNIEKAL